MADKLSKFNIKGTLADVIDAEARASIAELTESVAGMSSDVSSAVSTAEDAKTTAEDAKTTATDALNGLASKQNASDAWKIEKTSGTVELTVAAGGSARLSIPNSKGLSAHILSARSADKTRTLVPVNLIVGTTEFTVLFYNVGSSAYTSESMTLEVTYAYQ